MKNKKRLILISFGLGMFFCTIAPIIVNAQEKTVPCEKFRYEIAIDILPFFDDQYLWKGHFKVFNFKDDDMKGAFRFNVSYGYSSIFYPDYKEDKSGYSTNGLLTIGYEKYTFLGTAVFYYGVDFGGYYFKDKTKPSTVNDNRILGYQIIPFIGVRKQIIKCLAASFEIGWRNDLSFDKELNKESPLSARGRTGSFVSNIEIPYSLTINYRF